MAENKAVEVPTYKSFKARIKSTGKPAAQGAMVGAGEVLGEVVSGSKFVGSLVGLLAIPTIGDDSVRKSMAAMQGKELVKELFM